MKRSTSLRRRSSRLTSLRCGESGGRFFFRESPVPSLSFGSCGLSLAALVEVEVGGARQQGLPVLRRRAQAGGEVALGFGATGGAAASLATRLSDREAHWREVEDLPAGR